MDSETPIITQSRPHIPKDLLSKKYVPSTVRIVDYPAYQASKVYVEVIRGCSNYQRTKIPLPDGRECTDCGNCDSMDPLDSLSYWERGYDNECEGLTEYGSA